MRPIVLNFLLEIMQDIGSGLSILIVASIHKQNVTESKILHRSISFLRCDMILPEHSSKSTETVMRVCLTHTAYEHENACLRISSASWQLQGLAKKCRNSYQQPEVTLARLTCCLREKKN